MDVALMHRGTLMAVAMQATGAREAARIVEDELAAHGCPCTPAELEEQLHRVRSVAFAPAAGAFEALRD